MAIELESIRLTTASDSLHALGLWIRRERQRVRWTQADLASRSGVPAATISRLERTGLASTDSLFHIVFALDRLEVFQDFLKERLRQAEFPLSAVDDPSRADVLRVRHCQDR